MKMNKFQYTFHRYQKSTIFPKLFGAQTASRKVFQKIVCDTRAAY